MEYTDFKEQIKAKLISSQEINENENLLKYGLDSLKIMRLINVWRKSGIKVSYGELMKNPTLKNWWEIIEKVQKKKKTEAKVEKKKINEVEYFKPFSLTDVQYSYKIGRTDISCHAYLEFSGRGVDPLILEKAWNTLQYHHPMLRARFLEDGTQEIMDKPYDERIIVKDLRECTDVEKNLKEIRNSLSHRKLKVEEGQVAGITLSILPGGNTIIHFDLDLLVSDVQSMQIILRDLSLAYMGKALPEDSKNWSFANYLEIEKDNEKEEKKQAERYWKSRLNKLPFGPELPLEKELSEVKDIKFKRRIIRIGKDEWDILQKKAADNNATAAMLLLSSYAMILERFSRTKDFLINIPLFNRKTEYKGLEDVVADFTTLLLMEVDMREKKTFIELLTSIQKQVHEDMKYSSYSGVQVQRDLTGIYGENQNIAPYVFACNLGNPLITKDFKNNLGEFSYMISQTPGVYLDFQVYEDEAGLMLTWDTVDEIFKEGMIDDMFNSFEEFLHKLSREDWNQYFDVLPQYQKEFIEKQKNIQTLKESECLYEAFLRNAKIYPEKIAIIDTGENIEITYSQLEKKALSIASAIVEKNISNKAIAISLTRGYKQAIAALGILLSGNIYVPVSLNQPKERRKLIHKRTGINYAITDDKNLESIEWPQETEVFVIENLLKEKPLDKLPLISSENSAYIIMTSGTTGFPKGAEMYHKGAYNTITDVNRRFNITNEDSVLGVSSIDFDLSVYDLFGSLSSGGTLIMIPEERNRDAEFWLNQVMKYNITVWNSVPTLLDMLLIQAEAENVKLPLKRVMLSGDWIGMDLPERVEKFTEDCKFIAMGGATEASIWSNFMEVKLPIPKHWKSIPYGRPLAHQSYRVVDEKGIDVPFWVEGELLIGGAGVGTYRGDDELVKKKFIKEAGCIWYKTGDKGRFWNDGTIEFLGREDFQVKIRGHRIELGEIEAAIKSIEGVNRAVVEASDGSMGDKHLIAYLETSHEKNPSLYIKDEELQKKIKEKWGIVSNSNIEISKEKEFNNALIYGEWKACKAMLETLQKLNAFKLGKKYSYDEIVSCCKVARSQKETLKNWLKDLIQYGFIKEENGLYLVLEKAKEIQIDENDKLKKIDAYIDKLKVYLPDLIQGNKNPLQVYYAENGELSPNNLLEQLPGTEDNINVLIEKIKKVQEKSNEKIRILELGTRDIKVTKNILNTISSENTEYVYSDSSVFFVNEAKEVLNKYSFVKYEVLDLEKENLVLGKESQYDFVIAVNSIHRMKDLNNVFNNIKKLLLPDGVLLMLELTIETYLKDITAAILEGDKENKRESTLLNSSQWKNVLEKNKFDKICTYPKEGTLNGRNIFTVMAEDKVYVLNNEYISSSIKEKLPEYMVPRVYYGLEKVPLSKNGKIDRKALRLLNTEKVEVSSYKEEPSTKSEKQLREIWREVFKIEDIGVLDNYYLLGGDSLIATRMINKIRDKFKVAYAIKDIMELKTIREQAKRIDELLKEDKKLEVQNLPSITHDIENENKPFPLTEVQQAYWIGRSGMYDLGQVSTHCYFELDSKYIDIKKLQSTWNDMIKYHGMMRAVILQTGEQQILKEVPEYRIEVTDLRHISDEEVNKKLENIRYTMSHQVISTESWPLFDVKSTILKDEKVRLHISFDNLIFDGWSMFYLLREWSKRYNGKFNHVKALNISFRDYVLGLEELKNTEAYKKDKEYWMNRIEEFSSAPDIPLAKKENDIKNQRFNRRSAYLEEKKWNSLKLSAKEYGVTPAVLLITAYSEVLRRWSLNSNFTLNLTQFNREPLHPEVNKLVGDFTTLTLLEIKNSKESTFLERMKFVQAQLMKDLEHNLYSAIEFERELKQRKGDIKGSIMPIVFTSGLGISEWSSGEWIGTPVYNISQTPQVWLDHQVVEEDGGLNLFWDSVDELFYDGMLDEMFSSYVNLLNKLASNKDLFISNSSSIVEVPISMERKTANKTEKKLEDKTLDEMFLEMEKKYADKAAVINCDNKITYKELKEKALYICRQLQELNTKKEELVAILMKKGLKQIISVYGILFAGAAYLPLDSENPRERLEKILNNSKAKTILVSEEYLNENEWLKQWNCIVVDGVNVEKDSSIIAEKDTSSLAYTIYTSGTTGTPKGVMISHKAAVNTILDINERYQVTKEDSVLALSKLHFDLSVYDVFGILGAGGTLVIPNADKAKEPSHWIDLMNENKITIFNSVPAFIEILIEYEEYQNKLVNKDLRLVLMSGDWIPMSLPSRINNIFAKAKIIGLGGATEAGIWSNSFEIPKKIPSKWRSIPYGKPLSNQKYYVMDENMNERPDWVSGILYIAGRSLADGYINDKEKTEEKFVFNPMTKERLYSTGDMGRYWKDGNIEFLGRVDFQTKINGYRIELGEIEAAFNQYEGIYESHIVCVEDKNNKSLAAFYRSDFNIEEEKIKDYLREILPEYMVPNYIILLKEYPKTANDKIDTKKLTELAKESIKNMEKKDKKELVSDEEKAIAEVWEKVLGYKNVGRYDNFFSNGGNSLRAISMVNSINERFNVQISIQDIFQHSTVSKLAKLIFSKGVIAKKTTEKIEEGFF